MAKAMSLLVLLPMLLLSSFFSVIFAEDLESLPPTTTHPHPPQAAPPHYHHHHPHPHPPSSAPAYPPHPHHHHHPHSPAPTPTPAPAPTHPHYPPAPVPSKPPVHHYPPTPVPSKPPVHHYPPTPVPSKPPVHLYPPTHAPAKPPTHAPAKPPVHTPVPVVHPPAHPPVHPLPRSFVAVQGVVYVKSCKYAGVDTLLGAVPLLGAVVKLQCNNTRYKLVQTAKTDKNGYFFVEAPKTITTYGAHKCNVVLVSAPYGLKPSNLHGGVTGSVLRAEKPYFSNKLPFLLYTVGPLAFEPKCPH